MTKFEFEQQVILTVLRSAAPFPFHASVLEFAHRISDAQEKRRPAQKAVPYSFEFPPIDLGLIPGTGPEHPFEPFEYCERS